MTVETQEESCKLSVMNHLGDKADTYPLLSVYTSVAYAEGEVLLAAKSDAVGLGGIAIFESIDGCLLFLGLELHRDKQYQERYGQQGQRVPYVKPFAGGPNASS